MRARSRDPPSPARRRTAPLPFRCRRASNPWAVPMIEPLAKRWNRWRYLQASRVVLGTPPIPADGGVVVIFSMLTGRHILMYLFAAKSLYAHLRSGRFVVLDDGSMSEEDREVLRRHLKGVRILHIDQV